MDTMVLVSQQYLNAMYGGNLGYNTVSEDGQTGQQTINAIIRAFQIEMEISPTADNFGPASEAAFNGAYGSLGIQQQPDGQTSESNVYALLQCALWCKGYSTGASGITKHFYGGTGNAVKTMKADMGVDALSSTVSLIIMKCLLSMDQYKLIPRYGGKSEVRTIQQYLNANYQNYIGIIPCDGIYARRMCQALIIVLQAIEGYSVSEATGNFGSGTMANIPLLPDTNNVLPSAKEIAATKLLRFALACNGYSTGSANGTWDASIEGKIEEFQEDYCLTITGTGNLDVWMSLLVSKGNPNRNAQACDCATILDHAKASALKSAGYDLVGRYLTGYVGASTSKALTRNELAEIFNASMRVFPIFQTGTPSLSRYTYESGVEDAAEAYEAAISLGLHYNEILYFTIDYDIMDGQIASTVMPYFRGIRHIFAQVNNYYRIGIYGPRNICSKVSGQGLSVSSFVSDMSTGYSGNMGYPTPKDWAFDQFHEFNFSGNGHTFGLDKDVCSERYIGFDEINDPYVLDVPNVLDPAYYARAREIGMAFLGSFPDYFGFTLGGVYEYAPSPGLTITYKARNTFAFSEESFIDLYVDFDVENGFLNGFNIEAITSIFGALGTDIQGDFDAAGGTAFTQNLGANIGSGQLKMGSGIDPLSMEFVMDFQIESLVYEWDDLNDKLFVEVEIRFSNDLYNQTEADAYLEEFGTLSADDAKISSGVSMVLIVACVGLGFGAVLCIFAAPVGVAVASASFAIIVFEPPADEGDSGIV
jgi:peptidoglycan hydrolase-like protein with peptidoglycan-binding domain